MKNKGNKEIIGIGTYARMDDQWDEVAFVVREDFQGQGVAACLFKELEKVAAANGFIVFFTATLPENKSMSNLCKKLYSDKIKNSGDDVDIWVKFAQTEK